METESGALIWPPILAGVLSGIAGVYLLTRTANDSNSIVIPLAHGVGLYFLARALFMGWSGIRAGNEHQQRAARCPYCRESLHPEATACPHCQRSVTAAAAQSTALAPTTVACPHCGVPVPIDATSCLSCHGNLDLRASL
jgi:hypothetical protein